MGSNPTKAARKNVMTTSTAKYRLYHTYGSLSTEWLGEIPAHWHLRRLKYLATVNDEALAESTDPSVEIAYVDIGNVDSVEGITGREELVFEDAPSRARRIVRQGDVIISTVRTYLRAIARIEAADANIIVSTGFAVIRPRHLDDGFIAYALMAPYFVERVVAHSVGVSYPAINASDLACLDIAFPPLPEQRAIAAFLDRETAKIDSLVAKKERLIELLQEKRTTLISRAVTRGLDPDVPMKASDVEWLGEFPAHWTGLPLKRWVATKITDGPHETPELLPNGIDFISAEAVSQGAIDFERRRGFISPELHAIYSRKCKPVRDDILLCKSGATTGKLAKVDTDIDFSIWSPLAMVRADRSRISPRFLNTVLGAAYVQNQIRRTWSAGTQPNISMGDIERLYVVAPNLEEQAEILAQVDKETDGFAEIIAKVRCAIDRLQELRGALISAAVTGRIDVREEVA